MDDNADNPQNPSQESEGTPIDSILDEMKKKDHPGDSSSEEQSFSELSPNDSSALEDQKLENLKDVLSQADAQAQAAQEPLEAPKESEEPASQETENASAQEPSAGTQELPESPADKEGDVLSEKSPPEEPAPASPEPSLEKTPGATLPQSTDEDATAYQSDAVKKLEEIIKAYRAKKSS